MVALLRAGSNSGHRRRRCLRQRTGEPGFSRTSSDSRCDRRQRSDPRPKRLSRGNYTPSLETSPMEAQCRRVVCLLHYRRHLRGNHPDVVGVGNFECPRVQFTIRTGLWRRSPLGDQRGGQLRFRDQSVERFVDHNLAVEQLRIQPTDGDHPLRSGPVRNQRGRLR